jgi:sugar phosphate permease
MRQSRYNSGPADLPDAARVAVGRWAATLTGEQELEADSTLESQSATTRVLPFHLVAMVLLSTSLECLFWLIPYILRIRFDASDWMVTVSTAAVPTLLATSVFWNDVLKRMTVRRYLLLQWAAVALPLLLGAMSQNRYQLVTCHVLAGIGLAGWSPVNGEILRRFYSQRVRGRAFSSLVIARLLTGAVFSYFVGPWLDWMPNAFRIFMPAAAVLHLLAVFQFQYLVRVTQSEGDREIEPFGGVRQILRGFEPVKHTLKVLAQDRNFRRYETAFMVYGIGWMFCTALMPLLATDRLHMDYENVGESTQVAFKVAMLLTILPMGWVMDRLGPARTCGMSFAFLMIYPATLIFADSVSDVAVATALFGVAMSGVHVGWNVGPVTLAPDRARAPQYLAIHATLVGVRGAAFPFLGVGIYKLSGSFNVSLALAVAAFGVAALLMWQLQGIMRLKPASKIVEADEAAEGNTDVSSEHGGARASAPRAG